MTPAADVSWTIVAAVLFAAACHAAWNAVIKIGIDPFARMVLVAVGSGVVALPLVPLVGAPAMAAWPWLAVSGVIHLAYSVGLIESYRAGDLSQVYPIARGSAPLLTAVASIVFVGDPIAPIAWAGIVLLGGGVLMLTARGGRDFARFDRRAVGFALFTAVTICAYSLVDGMGARRAGSAHAYVATFFVLYGLEMAALALAWRGAQILPLAGRYWKSGLAGGLLSFIGYWIVLWAMTKAPIAIVAALRETSVLFGTALAVTMLGEPLRALRVFAAVLIVAGLALVRLH
jgi:drug/metabolite transporter (DMT)-like permease